jgi:hypothetical protein
MTTTKAAWKDLAKRAHRGESHVISGGAADRLLRSLARASTLAEDLLKDLNFTQAPIDPLAIAAGETRRRSRASSQPPSTPPATAPAPAAS